MYKIYKIIYHNKIIYIGRTTQPLEKRRKSGYLYIPKNILDESTFELIEITSDQTRERYWIEYYLNLGFILYNRNKGDKCKRDKIYYYTYKNDKKHYY